MQGITRSQIIPAVSSREAFAAIDAAKLEQSPAQAIAEHTGDSSLLTIIREQDGTGNELHVEVFPDGRIQLWAREPVFWFGTSEVAELIGALAQAHIKSAGIARERAAK